MPNYSTNAGDILEILQQLRKIQINSNAAIENVISRVNSYKKSLAALKAKYTPNLVAITADSASNISIPIYRDLGDKVKEINNDFAAMEAELDAMLSSLNSL